MSKILPIGAEYEDERYPSAHCSAPRDVIVRRWRVVDHRLAASPAGGTTTRATVELISDRIRPTVVVYYDGVDVWGRPVLRRQLDGDPPSPDYATALAEHGVEVPNG